MKSYVNQVLETSLIILESLFGRHFDTPRLGTAGGATPRLEINLAFYYGVLAPLAGSRPGVVACRRTDVEPASDQRSQPGGGETG